MNKTFIKTKTKQRLKMKTLKTYAKTFFTSCILKTTPSKQLFIPLLRTSEENAKSSGRHKGSCWTLIIFFSKVINFEHFAQTSTITKLFIIVQIWLVQSLGLKFQSSLLSTINSNPPFAFVISSIWYSPLPFWPCSFAIVSSFCFTSEIQKLMFLCHSLLPGNSFSFQ